MGSRQGSEYFQLTDEPTTCTSLGIKTEYTPRDVVLIGQYI